MCHKTKCETCKKWTWAGCGNHIQSALAGVPQQDRCTVCDALILNVIARITLTFSSCYSAAQTNEDLATDSYDYQVPRCPTLNWQTWSGWDEHHLRVFYKQLVLVGSCIKAITYYNGCAHVRPYISAAVTQFLTRREQVTQKILGKFCLWYSLVLVFIIQWDI